MSLKRLILFVFSCSFTYPVVAQDTYDYTLITYSQVGYDVSLPKNAMVQNIDSAFLSSESFFILKRVSDDKKLLSGNIESQGKKWGKFWWKIDFSKCNTPGSYYLTIGSEKQILFVSKKELPIVIGKNLLWNKTWYATALVHLQIRDSLSYKPEGGWKDCGSTLQELSSHAIMLNALCDLLELAPGQLTEKNKQEIYYHLLVGADYVALCQDRAAAFGYKEGAVVHEVRQNYKVVTGNVAKTAMILARISRIIKDENLSKSDEYKSRSLKSYQWIEKYGPVMHGGTTIVLPSHTVLLTR